MTHQNRDDTVRSFIGILRHAKDRLAVKLSKAGPRWAIVGTIVVLAAVIMWTTYYTVPSDSVAVVQRFGKYYKQVQPGLHFKLPLGIDSATIVPVKRQLKQEFGFETPGATEPFQSPNPRDAKRETQMVTGDLNAALVEVGGSIPHLGSGEVPLRGPGAERKPPICFRVGDAGGSG